MSAAGAGILGGAIGGGLAVTVLAPLTAANNFLGSYFFGSGMILGERQMYQDDWIKIKKRLDAGESFLTILEEVMKPNTQAVMQMARETVIAVSKEWNDIVLSYLQSIPQSIWVAINKINAGEEIENPWPLGEGIIGFVDGKVRCAQGYLERNNKCVKISDPATITPPVTQSHIHDETHHKTQAQINAEREAVQREIEKAKDPLMVQYTTFLNDIVSFNKSLRASLHQIAIAPSGARASKSRAYNALVKLKKEYLLKFSIWKRNNARWLSVNKL